MPASSTWKPSVSAGNDMLELGTNVFDKGGTAVVSHAEKSVLLNIISISQISCEQSRQHRPFSCPSKSAHNVTKKVSSYVHCRDGRRAEGDLEPTAERVCPNGPNTPTPEMRRRGEWPKPELMPSASLPDTKGYTWRAPRRFAVSYNNSEDTLWGSF